MFLKDFAEIRGVKADTVATYIRRHPEIAALTSSEGYQMVLSDEAIEILDKKYPMPKPVQIVQDTESLKKLAEAQAKLNELHEKYEELLKTNTKLALQAGRVQLLQEANDKNEEKIASQTVELADLKAEKQQLEARAGTAEQELAEARQELDRLKNRSFFQRLFNK